MGTIRQFPVFCAAMALCVVAGVMFAWQYRALSKQAGMLQQRLERERRERQLLETQVLLAAPGGRDRTVGMEREKSTRRALLAALARGEAALLAEALVPGSRTEACAALAEMAQGLRELATERGIGVAADEGFGFSEFAQAGPEPERLAEVHRQSRVVAAAVRLLIDARPTEIRVVRRGTIWDPNAGPIGAGGFALPATRSLRVGGLAASTVVRLEFTGHSGVLRDLLNGLARAESLLAVRSVEVEPLERAISATGTDKGEPWLASELMKYSVTLECVHLEPGAVAELSAGAVADVAVRTSVEWSTPPVTPEARTHCDLFTAPTVDYDPVLGEFAVRRHGETPLPRRSAVPGLEVAPEIQRQLYRIQLLGYIGAGADGLGTFADLESGVTFLARAGDSVPGSAIAVRALRRIRRTPGWVTVAEIEDFLTGETTMLTDESRKETEVMP
jgi:hypothetical protein